jgi:hypothetical protein
MEQCEGHWITHGRLLDMDPADGAGDDEALDLARAFEDRVGRRLPSCGVGPEQLVPDSSVINPSGPRESIANQG